MNTKNKKKQQKSNELKYEPIDRVKRWNYCQTIASLLYKSKRSNEDLETVLIEFDCGLDQL